MKHIAYLLFMSLQFRVINAEGNAFALCPGIRMRNLAAEAEHSCIGSTSNFTSYWNEVDYCGDFAAFDWTHSEGLASDPILYTSAVMIFYR